MSLIVVNQEALSGVSQRFVALQGELVNIKNQMRQCTDSAVEAGFTGQTSDRMQEFVYGPASNNLDQCADMCEQMSYAINHTCEQFAAADQQLSGTFGG
ncbi:MAG: hypothetical protein FWD05_05865 [Oscillospiraceae bacterium]|nr:hypothetical protein [Oscillospiraceae bacterium]